MSKGVRNAKGAIVDFDLLKIKNQIASAPKTTSVKAREDFIDQKFKRRLKRLKRDITPQTGVADVVEQEEDMDNEEDQQEE